MLPMRLWCVLLAARCGAGHRLGVTPSTVAELGSVDVFVSNGHGSQRRPAELEERLALHMALEDPQFSKESLRVSPVQMTRRRLFGNGRTYIVHSQGLPWPNNEFWIETVGSGRMLVTFEEKAHRPAAPAAIPAALPAGTSLHPVGARELMDNLAAGHATTFGGGNPNQQNSHRPVVPTSIPAAMPPGGIQHQNPYAHRVPVAPRVAGPGASASRRQVPYWYHDGVQWLSYTPANYILVVGHGSGMGNNPRLAEKYNMGFEGFASEVVYDGRYDQYPVGWELRAHQLPELPLEAFQGNNLATLALDVFCKRLAQRVKENRGHGPAAVIAGSRGGQVTIGVIWRHCFRGPTVVLNGGVSVQTEVPADVTLVVATGGQDYFRTTWEETRSGIWHGLSSSLQKGLRMMEYHCESDTHTPIASMPELLGPLVNAAISGLPEEDVRGAQAAIQKAVSSGVCPSAKVRYLREDRVLTR